MPDEGLDLRPREGAWAYDENSATWKLPARAEVGVNASPATRPVSP